MNPTCAVSAIIETEKTSDTRRHGPMLSVRLHSQEHHFRHRFACEL
jgi:hypothetical protein